MDIEKSKIAVLGYGVEGVSTTTCLLNQGLKLTILEQKESPALAELIKQHQKNGVRAITGENYLDSLTDFDLIFRTPGIPIHHPKLQEAVQKGVVITSQVKYFLQNYQGRTIGITGTKGKGTTATMVKKMLDRSGQDVILGGNIGDPLLDFLPRQSSSQTAVMELSSFQLADLDQAVDIAVLLNITEDHLDHHQDLEDYHQAKYNLVRHLDPDQWLVYNQDYQTSAKAKELTKAKIFPISTKEYLAQKNSASIKDEQIIISTEDGPIEVEELKNIKLLGRHNWENVLAATAATYLAGAELKAIKQVINSFSGLEHRLEFVGEKENLEFYNDSFSTNPQPTMAALNSFEKPIVLIAGGQDKGLNYDNLAAQIKLRPVKGLVLVGEAGRKILQALGTSDIPILTQASNMSEMVEAAVKLAHPGDVILLSPAASSFDMFTSYKERGQKFKEVVTEFIK